MSIPAKQFFTKSHHHLSQSAQYKPDASNKSSENPECSGVFKRSSGKPLSPTAKIPTIVFSQPYDISSSRPCSYNNSQERSHEYMLSSKLAPSHSQQIFKKVKKLKVSDRRQS